MLYEIVSQDNGNSNFFSGSISNQNRIEIGKSRELRIYAHWSQTLTIHTMETFRTKMYFWIYLCLFLTVCVCVCDHKLDVMSAT